MEPSDVDSLSSRRRGLRYMILISLVILGVLPTGSRAQEDVILTYDVDEEAREGQVVGRVFLDAGLDSDPEISQQGYLTFTDSSASSLFTLTGGRVLTTGPRLDRDVICAGQEECVMDLDLQLQPPSFFRIIKVKVTVIDINDNAPEFTDAVTTRSISEAATENSKIPLPSANDPDSPLFGIDHYQINDTSVFELDSPTSSGSPRFLLLKGQVDREEQEVFYIALTAVDRGTPAKSGSTVLEIHVADVNDNVPEFANDSYSVSVPEDFPVGLPVIRVQATDKDTGTNADIVYGFDASTADKYGQLFVIEPASGVIRVRAPLDYEALTSATLTITATNGEDTSMSSFTNVHVSIEDVNDNPPTARVHGVSQRNVIYKEESAVLQDFVAHISVSDPDSGDNGKFDCLLSGRDFVLKSMFDTNFAIHTNIPLDREDTPEYDVTVTCTDRGTPRQSSVLDLKIVVADVNDNTPVFTQDKYYATVMENNPPGFPVVNVRAIDSDNGLNGTVRYSLVSGGDLLHIDSINGSITAVAGLDREQVARLEAVVVARDLGTPEARSSSTTLVIDVIDQDDNGPEFTQEEFSFRISEGQPPRSYVGQVTALDRDSEVFAQFGYYIDQQTPALESAVRDAKAFTIDRSSGKLYTSKVLEREEQATFTFLVRTASEGQGVLRTATSTVVVHLDDINNQDPVIVFPTPANNSVYLSNRVPVGSVISKVMAHDLDDGPNAELSYVIVSGDSAGYFRMDFDGSVVVARSLEEFNQRAFGLVVMVTDNGSPPRSTESYLNVVVNRSLATEPEGGALISHRNLTIVVVIATISGVVMVVLVVAIVLLLRWPRMRAAKNKYNYVARAHSCTVSRAAAYDNPGLDVEKGLRPADNTDSKGGSNTEHKPSGAYHEQKSAGANHEHKPGVCHEHKQAGAYHEHKPGAYRGNTVSAHGVTAEEQRDSSLEYDSKLVLARQHGRDSECLSSTSSGAETDSGRGSHDEIVLDQSTSRMIGQKGDLSPGFKSSDLPILSALQLRPDQAQSSHHHVAGVTTDWRASQRSRQGQTCPPRPEHVPYRTQSIRDPTTSSSTTAGSTSGYSWKAPPHSRDMSSGVRV